MHACAHLNACSKRLKLSHRWTRSALTVAGGEQCTSLSILAENNFNDRGDTTLNQNNTYKYKLSCGYSVSLTGWTHTRDYAKGFLRDQPGDAKAVVAGLKPGQTYNFKIFQYAGQYAGTNSYTVNGQSGGTTTSRASDAATVSSTAVADACGEITFVFKAERNLAKFCAEGVWAKHQKPCDETIRDNGKDYRGCQTQTRSGKTCQVWPTTDEGYEKEVWQDILPGIKEKY